MQRVRSNLMCDGRISLTARLAIALRIVMVSLRRDLGKRHPLLGRRMPDLELLTDTARFGSSPCCTMPGRCCLISVSPAVLTSLHGQTGFGRWTPNMLALPRRRRDTSAPDSHRKKPNSRS